MNDAIVQEMARKGWQAGNTEVAFQACDDSLASTGEWDENLCRSNADAYAGDPDVIGVIGTYNSGCAQVMIPILNKAPGGGLPMVSPGNTLVCLTEPGSTSASRTSRTSTTRRARATTSGWSPTTQCRWPGSPASPTSRGSDNPFILVRRRRPDQQGPGATPSRAPPRKLGMNIAGTAQWDQKANELHEPDGPGEGLGSRRGPARRACSSRTARS